MPYHEAEELYRLLSLKNPGIIQRERILILVRYNLYREYAQQKLEIYRLLRTWQLLSSAGMMSQADLHLGKSSFEDFIKSEKAQLTQGTEAEQLQALAEKNFIRYFLLGGG